MWDSRPRLSIERSSIVFVLLIGKQHQGTTGRPCMNIYGYLFTQQR